jgi:hypothetical protein
MWSARPPTDVDDKRPQSPSLLAELLEGDPRIAGVTISL